jgi:hypothetical protein
MGRKLGRKSTPSAIPKLGVSHHVIETPTEFCADLTCHLQASLRALTAQLDRSALRDLQATQTGDLASSNLKDQWRMINT